MVTPETKLLACILLQAIRDATSYGPDSATIRRGARSWLGTTGNVEPLKRGKGNSYTPKDWSFVWVCEHLDLYPSVIRQEVIKVQKVGVAPIVLGMKVGLDTYLEKVYDRGELPCLPTHRSRQGMS